MGYFEYAPVNDGSWPDSPPYDLTDYDFPRTMDAASGKADFDDSMFANHSKSRSFNDSVMPMNCSEQLKFFEEMNEFYPHSQIVVPVVYCIICIVGLIGNGLVMFVIFGSKEMTKTVANIYIWNLAVADTLFLVTLPFSSTQRFMLSWPFGAGMCKIVEAVKYLNYFASIFFLTAMSIDRYIAVVYVVTSSKWRTSRNTFFICASIWLVSLVMVIPLLIYTRLDGEICALVFNASNDLEAEYDYEYFDCTKLGILDEMNIQPVEGSATQMQDYDGDGMDFSDYGEERNELLNFTLGQSTSMTLCKHKSSKTFHVFLIFTTVVGFVIPFFVISVCYTMIVVRLLQPSETRGRSKQAERTRRKVTRMVVALVITFFICWLPFYVWHLMLIRGVKAKAGVCHNVRDFTFCLGFANSCLNPILYTFLGHNFQERLRKSIAISFRSFSFTTFTKYTTNTVSRAETPAHSKKLDASNYDVECSSKVFHPLCSAPEENGRSARCAQLTVTVHDKLLENNGTTAIATDKT